MKESRASMLFFIRHHHSKDQVKKSGALENKAEGQK